MKYLFGALAICAGLTTSAQAATINIAAAVGAGVNHTLFPGIDRDEAEVFDQDALQQDSVVTNTLRASAQAAVGPVSGTASSFADADTGILRAETAMSGARGDGFGTGSASASARLEETYTVSGTGTLTVSMLVDGNWDLSRPVIPGIPDPEPIWQVQADIAIGTTRDFLCLGTSCGPSLDQSPSGSITDYLLTATADFTGGGTQIVRITSQLLMQIGTGNGFIDFGNTAKLLVEASDGLTITPSDPDFLSNPAFLAGSAPGTPPIAPIPLPAAGWLLIAGLGGLGLLRARS